MSSPNRFESPLVFWLNQHAPQGIIITDTELVIRDWNVWMEVNTGIQRSAVDGKSLFSVFPDLVTRGLNGLYEDALNGQIRIMAHRFHRYLIPARSPAEPHFDQMQQTAHIAPLVDQDNIVGTITAITDVTERVVREKELNDAREAADAANQSKDRFVAMLSHDLRVPLSSVIGWVQILKKRPENEELRNRALKSIEDSARTQVRMIEDLLDVTRISSGKLTLDTAATDIADAVASACTTLKPIADAKSIRLIPSIQCENAILQADVKRIQQVVWNLVSNSVKFTPAGGTIHVRLTRYEQGLRLTVADNGIGISPSGLAHVFEPMWQSGENENSTGGLGLGLTIVRKIVELHGGTVRAESPGKDQGTTFIVELPWEKTTTRSA